MTENSLTFRVKPSPVLQGRLRVPGDKSISHRALMLAAIAEGQSHLQGFLAGADCLRTLDIMRSLGVTIEADSSYANVAVRGVGQQGLQAAETPLYCGNSGTSMRLLAGLLAGQRFASELTGDESLQRRPMRRIAEPLRLMGARLSLRDDNYAPVSIAPVEHLYGIDYTMPVASAQVKSAILLASLYASGETRLREPARTRDHTERMFERFGCSIHYYNGEITVPGQQKLRATDLEIPADLSSAAFFMVAASIARRADIVLERTGDNVTRNQIVDMLQALGANIRRDNPRWFGSEAAVDFRVQAAPLKGQELPIKWVPGAIDELPVLMIAAACAEGTTIIHGAQELRVKESDRLAAMAQGLKAVGISVEEFPDGIAIQGGRIKGGRVQSHGDHRIAMAFAIAGVAAEDEIVIEDCANVTTSFPNFIEQAREVGLLVSEE